MFSILSRVYDVLNYVTVRPTLEIKIRPSFTIKFSSTYAYWISSKWSDSHRNVPFFVRSMALSLQLEILSKNVVKPYYAKTFSCDKLSRASECTLGAKVLATE